MAGLVPALARTPGHRARNSSLRTGASNIQGAEIFVDGGSTGSPAGAPIYRG
jgi:hypothetical protein